MLSISVVSYDFTEILSFSLLPNRYFFHWALGILNDIISVTKYLFPFYHMMTIFRKLEFKMFVVFAI